MSDRSPFQDLLDAMAEDFAERLAVHVDELKSEMVRDLKPDKLLYTDAEAADLLGCSRQTMARIRKRKEIASTTGPSGRPAYLFRHLQDYLDRREIRVGKGRT